MTHDDRSQEVALESLEEVQAMTLEFALASRREIHLYSPDLEPRLYDHSGFVDALRTLALATRHARIRIRILASDVDSAVRHGHRLIELSRKLTSFISIRTLSTNLQERMDAFLVVDRRAVLHRPHWLRHDGTASRDAPKRARLLIKEFEALWNVATPDPELRRLHL